MSNKKINPHDKFFKSIFSQKEQAREFLEKTTPQELVERLYLDSLQLDPTDYVDENLQEYFADVVYNCQYKISENETERIKISFIFEHKSYKEHIPYLQLLRYMLNVWDNQVKQAKQDDGNFKDFRLQPIIPIIFYHGKTKWNKAPFESYFAGQDEFLLRFIPKFEYHLIDMADYPNAKINQLFRKRQLQVALLLMKNIFYENQLIETLREIFSSRIEFSDKETERQFYKLLGFYIYYSTENSLFQKIKELMETIHTNQSKEFVSIADMLIMQGEQKGIQKRTLEIAFTMIKKGFNDETIIELTGLNKAQIDYLRGLDEFNFD